MNVNMCRECGQPIPDGITACPTCHRLFFDDDNPYAPPPPGELDTMPDALGYDYKLIAQRYRLLNYSVLALLLMFLISMVSFLFLGFAGTFATGSPSRLQALFVLFMLGIALLSIFCSIFLIVAGILVASAIKYGPGMRIVFFLLLCYVPLIPICILAVQANGILKRAGYKVGLLGPNMRQFDEERPPNVSIENIFISTFTMRQP